MKDALCRQGIYMATRELLLGSVLSESRKGLAEHCRALSRLLCPTCRTLAAMIDKMDCQSKPSVINGGSLYISINYRSTYIFMATSGRFSVDGYRKPRY